MTKVTYIGDPNDNFSGPDELTVGKSRSTEKVARKGFDGFPPDGITFRKDEAQDVAAKVAARLAGNSHFTVGDAEKPKPKPKPKPAPVAAQDDDED